MYLLYDTYTFLSCLLCNEGTVPPLPFPAYDDGWVSVTSQSANENGIDV